MAEPGASECPLCGANFTCDILAGKEECWCMAFPTVMTVPGTEGKCYCPACLEKIIAEKTGKS